MKTVKGSHLKNGTVNRQVPAAEVHGEDPGDLNLTLWDIFSNTASRHPNREALVSMWQSPWSREPKKSASRSKKEGNNLRWTYLDLLKKSERVAISLEKLGCRKSMRLAAILWNSSEWALFFWVAAKLGLVFCPIDPRNQHEAQDVLGSLNPGIVVVQDADGATLVNATEHGCSEPAIYIQCSETPVDGWVGLDNVFSGEHMLLSFPRRVCDGDSSEILQNDALIIFTSGTNGRPKGCPHSNANLMAQTSDYDPNLDVEFVDRWLIHTPVSHIFAVNNALRAWRYGGAVVFPSRAFDVESTAHALVQEKCTIMSATPTLVRALLAHPSCPTPQDMSLSMISIAATKITAKDIRLCRKQLGAKDTVQAYGMSEGAPLISWSRRDKLFQERPDRGVGKVLPGASIRVCHPTTGRVLDLHEVGELHVSGPSVIAGYLNHAETDTFYEDNAGRWLATGDQAIITDNGVVEILGRYKDLIIRGGENLNPMRIEEALVDIKGVQAWVVGAEDSLAGEVPVAVAQLPKGISKAQLYEKAANLGPKYVLGGIYTLDQLQLEDVPRTSIGKVKKGKLRDAVRKFRAQQSSKAPLHELHGSISTTEDASAVSVTQLIEIWEELTGSRPSPSTQIAHIADSITLLRYCDAIFRFCGKRLYLQDVVEYDTIERHARLLEVRDGGHRHWGGSSQVSTNHPKGGYLPSPPPDYIDSSALGGPKAPQSTNSSGQEYRSSPRERLIWAEALSEMNKVGLASVTVEDIIPIRESLHRMVIGQRSQSYHVRMVFRVHNASVHQIRRGLEKALVSRPMLRTMLLNSASEGLYHIVLGISHDLFENIVLTRELELEKEAEEHWQDDSEAKHSFPLMFQAEIISVRESENSYLSMLFNHSVVDALSLWPWHKDLDLLIDDINAKTWTPTPFKMFSDLFSQYQNSVPAQEAVSFHVRRLRGISRLKRALWPLQRAPGWMILSDRGSKYACARDEVRQAVWNGEWKTKASAFRYPRLGRVVTLSQLQELKKHGIEPSLFAKSAIVILNVLQTGASHAVFSTWESGRSWPFVPRWMEEMLPPAMSIDGPTVEWILDMIEVAKDENILDFLARMAAENEEMRNHEHVPWQDVVKELRDEGDVAIDASFRQSFVWDMSLGLNALKGNRSVFKCLEPVARLDWADCGLFWNAFMIDPENMFFIASWDTAQMNDVEVEACCDLLADVMRKLGDGRNWAKTVGEVFQ